MEAQARAFLASLESQAAYSESTCLAYASDLRIFMSFSQRDLNRPVKLSDLNAKQVVNFIEAERQAGRRHSTLIRRLATLRSFVTYLIQGGVLQKDVLSPDEHLITQAISTVPPSSGPQCLTIAQVENLKKIFEASTRNRARRDLAILILLLETGLSVGALVDLDLTDLDLRAERMRITSENGYDTWLPLGTATEPLERYLQEGRPEMNLQPNEPALFVSQMGGRMSRQGIWQILHHWGQLTDPPIKLSPRMVRHTAALRMAQGGRPLVEIQTLLGHNNPLSTQALLRRLQANVSCSDQDS